MLYILLKPIVKIFYQIYYRIHFIGLSHIPKNKAVILAPNHVNGFVDPILFGIKVQQKIRFYARGDVFKNKIAKFFLNQFNISPVFRIQEGYSELKKNDATFLDTKKFLGNNKTILLFPEAICVQEKRLRPLKKGLARIAFQVEEGFSFKKEVLIIPIGINYESPKRFRSKIYVNIGKPVSLQSYEHQFAEDKVKTINNFTKAFENNLSEHLIIIKNKNYDVFFDNIIELFLIEWMTFKKYELKNKNLQYAASKEIANFINNLETHNESLLISLDGKAKKYFALLNKHKLRNHLLNPIAINKMNMGSFLKDYLFIYLGLPLYALGLFLNYLPFYIAKKYADKKVRHNEFYSSVRLNLFMILWILFYPIIIIAIAMLLRNWLLLITAIIVIPLLGIFCVHYYSLMKKIIGRSRLLRLVRKQREVVENLVSLRSELIGELKQAIR